MTFEQGKIYNRRREIHGRYGGQRQGGMSTPKDHPTIFLFTGEGGAEHGYRDEPKLDGTYWYTGEGQRGDMAFVRANRALLEHHEDGKQVHLFEALGNGDVRYIGEVSYLGHHFEERPDSGGRMRQAIVFELGLEPPAELGELVQAREPIEHYSARQLLRKPLEELRRLALAGAGKNASLRVQRRNVHVRSDAVRTYVLRRAGGACEGCGAPAPFQTKQGQPYLEPHHTTRIADGGPDHPAHVIALCPTCHRRVHHAHDGGEYNTGLIRRLAQIEETD